MFNVICERGDIILAFTVTIHKESIILFDQLIENN